MTLKELRGIVSALETAHSTSRTIATPRTRPPGLFIKAVGADTAAQCVAAMVRRFSWDGRISRYAREWASGVALTAEWERRVDDVYTNSIHMAHLSQIAETMPKELEYIAAEEAEQ